MYSTAVGYAGGTTPHPTYHDTCQGDSGHVEVVHVVYDPSVLSTEALLNEFWSDHRPVANGRDDNADPLANRDGRTDQYRSIILATNEEQLDLALERRAALDAHCETDRWTATQISLLEEFYYAEDYHQQYSAKRAQRYTCS